MPRTTLDLDGTVLRQLRLRGRRQHKSMGAVASELLAKALADDESTTQASEFGWRSADLGTPSVDLEDKDTLLDALDRPA